MISFEIIHDKERIVDFQKHWDQLFDSGDYEASTSFDWTQALLKTHLKGNPFSLIVLRDSTEILGIVPLVISRTNKYGFSFSTIFPISEYYNTNSDLLLKKSTDEIIEIFLRALFSLPTRWDVFRVIRFIETNPLLAHMEHYLRKVSIKYQMRKEEPSFFLNLDGDFNDYLKKRSGNFRYNLNRKEKKMKALGKVKYKRNEDFQNVADAYNSLLYIEENSWKQKHGTAITAVKKQSEFYRELCESTFKNGWLHLRFLFLNNEPVAYNLGLVKHKRYYLLKLSYNEKFKRVSPATVLMAWVLKDLIQEGIKEYDFAGEPYEYERQWTDELQWHKSLIIYNDTFNGKMLSIYHRLNRKIKTFKKQAEFEYHNPKDIKPS